jgi:tagaturonate reductase
MRLLPSLLDYVAKRDHLPPRIVLAMAALLRFYQGEWGGQSLAVNDDPVHVTWFRQQWKLVRSPEALAEEALRNQRLWGIDLKNIHGFTEQLGGYLARIDTEGILPILHELNGTDP